MKFSGQTSIALNASALGSKSLKTSSGKRESTFLGAKVLDAMGQLEKRAIFERLVKEHLDSTTRVAIRLTGNQDLAEELVQETMLRAVRNWESFRHQAQFNTWLYRILINAFRDQHRTKPRVNFVEVQPNTHVAKSDPVEANVETTELSDLVGKLIAQLPERQREVLVLSTHEQLNNQQIADALKIEVSNVHATLSTARKKLKEWLARDGRI